MLKIRIDLKKHNFSKNRKIEEFCRLLNKHNDQNCFASVHFERIFPSTKPVLVSFQRKLLQVKKLREPRVKVMSRPHKKVMRESR